MQVTRGTVGPPQPIQTRKHDRTPKETGLGGVLPDVCMQREWWLSVPSDLLFYFNASLRPCAAFS